MPPMARTARHSSKPPSRRALRDLRRSLRVGLQPDPIIHRVAETLFAAQVPLRRLHRDMPKKELNLLQLTAGLMTKTGTSPTKVVWRERLDITSLRFLLHDTPNDFGAESVTPNPASLVDRTKERAGFNSGGRHPDVNSSFHPVRNRDCSYVAALADKIGNDPMILLSVVCLQRAVQSIPRGADRNPAEWPMWHSLAYLEGLYRLASTISA